MMNENREDKRIEKLTDEEMEQVTGGIWAPEFLKDWFDGLFGREEDTGYSGDYSYCPHCKDYTKTAYMSRKTVCAKCKKSKA